MTDNGVNRQHLLPFQVQRCRSGVNFCHTSYTGRFQPMAPLSVVR